MEQLSDAVYNFLEVQMEGLLVCQQLEASSAAAVVDSSQASVAGMVADMFQQYESLLHEMSMKFGFSVTQLQQRFNEATSAAVPPISSDPRLAKTTGFVCAFNRYLDHYQFLRRSQHTQI